MKKYISLLLFVVALFCSTSSKAQIQKPLTDADKSAIEDVVVEKYYVAQATDYLDTVGGELPKGSVTYRIYLDLKPGYSVQAVFGVLTHALKIETSTKFFNNTFGGERTGDNIDPGKLNMNTVALDSWVTIGAATKSHVGVLKADDKDGSILKRTSLNLTDGLKESAFRKVVYYGIDLSFFQDSTKTNSFYTDNGSWAVFGGVKGTTEDNKILIAQLTTNGILSFELNVQLGTPSGASVQYVAKNPEGAEIQFNKLVLKK